MSYETILVKNEEAAAVITLNRPDKRNAISVQLMDELTAALAIAESDETVRAVILTGGNSYFAAGADLNEALQVTAAKQGIEYFKRWHRLNTTVEELEKPVIAINTATYWHALRSHGIRDQMDGFGALLADY